MVAGTRFHRKVGIFYGWVLGPQKTHLFAFNFFTARIWPADCDPARWCGARVQGAEAGPHADLKINSHAALSRIFRDGKMGFCEAVMDGSVESNDMPALIELSVLHSKDVDAHMEAGFWRRQGLKLYHQLRSNTRDGSARNIAYHYDLGNEFYAAWLDGTMTYSSAVYETDSDDLSTAQTNKYRRLAELADIQPGDHVLEIGCGWGGFAKYAVEERGAHVTGITISRHSTNLPATGLPLPALLTALMSGWLTIVTWMEHLTRLSRSRCLRRLARPTGRPISKRCRAC